MALRGVATTMQVDESIEVSTMAAQLDVTKMALVRGVIRFGLSRKEELFQWLKDHRSEWVSY